MAAAAAAARAAEQTRIRKACSSLTMSKLGIAKEFDFDRNKFPELQSLIKIKLSNVSGLRLASLLVAPIVFNPAIDLGFGQTLHTVENAVALNMALIVEKKRGKMRRGTDELYKDTEATLVVSDSDHLRPNK